MYYLYRHIRLDKDEVFYVGISTVRDQYSTHRERYARAYQRTKSRNDYWKNIVNLTKYRVEIVYECETQEEIISKEKEFIELYKPTLCNMTEGGLGITSFKHSEESKERIGKFFRGRKLTEEHKRKVNLKKLKKIRLISDEQTLIFNSLSKAAVFLGNINYSANISACARGRRNKVKGYRCKYVNEVTEPHDKEHVG